MTYEKEKTVVIPKQEYDELVENSEWLAMLEAAGINNTIEYEHAIEMLEDMEDK